MSKVLFLEFYLKMAEKSILSRMKVMQLAYSLSAKPEVKRRNQELALNTTKHPQENNITKQPFIFLHFHDLAFMA